MNCSGDASVTGAYVGTARTYGNTETALGEESFYCPGDDMSTYGSGTKADVVP